MAHLLACLTLLSCLVLRCLASPVVPPRAPYPFPGNLSSIAETSLSSSVLFGAATSKFTIYPTTSSGTADTSTVLGTGTSKGSDSSVPDHLSNVVEISPSSSVLLGTATRKPASYPTSSPSNSVLLGAATSKSTPYPTTSTGTAGASTVVGTYISEQISHISQQSGVCRPEKSCHLGETSGFGSQRIFLLPSIVSFLRAST